VPLPLNTAYHITWLAMPTVRRALREFRPDVIHVNTMWLTGASLLKQARRWGIPKVATNHLMPENVLMSLPRLLRDASWLRDKFWRVLTRWHNKFDAVTSPTPTATKLLADHGLIRPLYDISNGVDTDYYHPGVANVAWLPPKVPYVLYFGRVNKEKRLDMLVRSFGLIADQTPAHLVIAGAGNATEDLAKLITQLKLSSRVHMPGLVDDETKLALAQGAQLFAITSPAELQSIVCLEAMACGQPIVAVNVAALVELCHDGENGYLVNLDDNQACANAILSILSDPQTRQRFGQFSRDFVVKYHSCAATERKFTELYGCAVRRAFPASL